MIYQVPISDVSAEECRFVESNLKEDMETFVQNLRSSNLRLGHIKEWRKGMPIQCPKCLLILEAGELVVLWSESDGPCFHPSCFQCFKCKSHLADLIHCADVDGTVFCVRHYCDSLKKRCYACDELIFSSRFALAGEKYYHRNHLVCFVCEEALNSNKGFEKDGELYCSQCYEKKFAKDCSKCSRTISVDNKHVTYRNDNWHYNCFTCHQCEEVLSDNPFEIVEDNFYCSECFTKQFAPRCHTCSEVFDSQTKVVKYEDKIYHVLCFKCVDCEGSIGTGSFVPHKDRVYCKACHLRNFGVRCFRCKYVITDNRGIRYNKEPYHEGCFTCNKCSTQIGNRPFKTVSEEWYCMNCYADSYCKKCHTCDKPIMLGTDQDILYSYQDYQWHAACFICSKCKKSLADSRFIIKDNTLICEDCMKTVNEISSQEKIIEAEKDGKDPSQQGAASS